MKNTKLIIAQILSIVLLYVLISIGLRSIFTMLGLDISGTCLPDLNSTSINNCGAYYQTLKKTQIIFYGIFLILMIIGIISARKLLVKLYK